VAQQDAAEPVTAPGEVFEWGPPRRLTALARLPAPLCPDVGSRALLAVAIGWLPLVLLVGATPLPERPAAFASFVHDIGTHARTLVAGPLFVLAFTVCARRLGLIASHFLESGLLDDAGCAAFTKALEKSRRLVRSLWAEAITVVIAYATMGGLLFAGPTAAINQQWQLSSDGHGFSPAGWWLYGVSVPLLLVLLLGWLWRILIWTLFLKKIASFDLKLVAAHPDQAAGLGFLTQSVRAFAVVGMALGTMTAVRFAIQHQKGVATPMTDSLLAGGTVALVCVLFIGPLLAFSAPMIRAWRSGAMHYGALATEIGIQFEKEWPAGGVPPDKAMLDRPDFSATTDLYSVVANVYAMRFVPVDFRSLVILLAATLAPFVPAMFLSMPAATVVETLKGLLF
jgi:hypothetical protein